VEVQANKVTERRGSIASLIGYCAVLGATLMPFAAGLAWFGYRRAGTEGVAAAAIAFGVCWLSGSLALVATFVGQRLGAAIPGVLVGMIFRMGLPLITGMALQRNSPPLAAAGVFLMILGLYLVGLLVETLLSLQLVPRTNRAPRPVEAVGVQSR
jgi:hypothetical protein